MTTVEVTEEEKTVSSSSKIVFSVDEHHSDSTISGAEYNGFDKDLAERLKLAYLSELCCDLKLIVGSVDKPPTSALCIEEHKELEESKEPPGVGSSAVEKKRPPSPPILTTLDGDVIAEESSTSSSKDTSAMCQVFTVNRLLLCSCSPVLNAMIVRHGGKFQDMSVDSDSGMHVLQLPRDSPLGMRKVVEYAYTGSAQLSLETVFDTLQVASKYSVAPLENMCCSFLETQITWKQAFEMLLKVHSAKKQFATDACLKVFWYRRPDELEEMFGDADFLRHTPLELLKVLVESDHSQIQEELIWEAVVKWNFLQTAKKHLWGREAHSLRLAKGRSIADAGAELVRGGSSTPVPEELAEVTSLDDASEDGATTDEAVDDDDADADDDDAKGAAEDGERHLDAAVLLREQLLAARLRMPEEEKGDLAEATTTLVAADTVVEEVLATDSTLLQKEMDDFDILSQVGSFGQSEPIHSLIPLVRFPLMDPAYFALKVLPLSLLSAEDAIAVFSHVHGAAAPLLRFSTSQRCSLSQDRLSNNVLRLSPSADRMCYGGSRTSFCVGSLIRVDFDFRKHRTLPVTSDRRRQGWIGLVPCTVQSRLESDNDEYDMDYFSLATLHGSCYLKCKVTGDFEVRAFTSDAGGEQIDTGVKVSIKAPAFPDADSHRTDFLVVNKNQVLATELIHVRFNFESYDNVPEPIVLNSGWVGIIPANIDSTAEDVNDNANVGYSYINALSGELRLSCRRQGEYEIRAFTRDDGGVQIAAGVPVSVRPLEAELRSRPRWG